MISRLSCCCAHCPLDEWMKTLLMLNELFEKKRQKQKTSRPEILHISLRCIFATSCVVVFHFKSWSRGECYHVVPVWRRHQRNILTRAFLYSCVRSFFFLFFLYFGRICTVVVVIVVDWGNSQMNRRELDGENSHFSSYFSLSLSPYHPSSFLSSVGLFLLLPLFLLLLRLRHSCKWIVIWFIFHHPLSLNPHCLCLHPRPPSSPLYSRFVIRLCGYYHRRMTVERETLPSAATMIIIITVGCLSLYIIQ